MKFKLVLNRCAFDQTYEHSSFKLIVVKSFTCIFLIVLNSCTAQHSLGSKLLNS